MYGLKFILDIHEGEEKIPAFFSSARKAVINIKPVLLFSLPVLQYKLIMIFDLLAACQIGGKIQKLSGFTAAFSQLLV